MKLRNKILIGIGITWAAFLILIYAASRYILTRNFLSIEHKIEYFILCFIILGILFSFIILWLLHHLVIKRLETLEIEVRTQELQKTNEQLQLEIIERKSIEDELTLHKEHLIRLAHYDSLTSLPNRVFFNEMLNKTISHAIRHDRLLAILFIDLDRFKMINDALGHTIGDLVLKEVALRFSSVIRSEDMLARLGGDEFIILLNDIGQPKFASTVAEKLLHICAKPIHINEHEFYITTSIGISIFPNDGMSLEDLQRNADISMYKAKKSGRGTYQYFTPEMNLAAHQHIQLESAMRKAIRNNEFVLYYQPQFNLMDGVITGVEALIRWESPEHGIINPGEFIPLAEETGLIIQLGEWAMREACRANKRWQMSGYQPLVMAVNLSPKQFRYQDIAHVVSNILTESVLDPQYLELEITETTVMDNVDLAIVRLNEISKKGVTIAIDDFGTGYTSISNLKLYPVSVLKIDKTFIKGIPHDYNDVAIVSAVISLAHNLNMKVVAEGVETAEQLQYLADHECDIVQGYYLSRPLPEHKLISLLTKLGDPTPV